VIDELELLGGGVEQREVTVGIHQRERQTRKTGARAHVENALAAQIGLDGQAI
jgi:hypothetical protein